MTYCKKSKWSAFLGECGDIVGGMLIGAGMVTGLIQYIFPGLVFIFAARYLNYWNLKCK